MCVVCNQKTKNELEDKIYKEALRLARTTGVWVVIYTDAGGNRTYVRADQAAGIPVERYVTPIDV